MAALHFLTDEVTVITQAGFILSLLFLVLYTMWHNWWENGHGVSLFLMVFGILVLTLRATLMDWHLLSNPQQTGLAALATGCAAAQVHHLLPALAICQDAVRSAAAPVDGLEWVTIEILLVVPVSLLIMCVSLVRRNVTRKPRLTDTG